jgi:hypothetical protein
VHSTKKQSSENGYANLVLWLCRFTVNRAERAELYRCTCLSFRTLAATRFQLNDDHFSGFARLVLGLMRGGFRHNDLARLQRSVPRRTIREVKKGSSGFRVGHEGRV